ncbi:MAG: sigma-70 family RNA polymerase sigma factor [Oscillospiraceae bacterium]|nr:sigma-70 family RNA polymerase sigma factor [Oscillospiraceae bacterium]
MDDITIMGMILAREETVINEIQIKYGEYMKAIALNILGDPLDAEECLNDALLALWNKVPDAKPESLKAYAAKTIRNTAINKLKAKNALKRAGTDADKVFEELENILPAMTSAEDEYIQNETGRLINRFLAELPVRDRNIFLRRYFFAESISLIADDLRLREGNVRLILSRTRIKLKKYLAKED